MYIFAHSYLYAASGGEFNPQRLKDITNKIDELAKSGTLRALPEHHTQFSDFSSNDYLGLSHNKNAIIAGYEAALKYGSGSTGSRLLSGNKEIFESQISQDKFSESSLIFTSGFSANYGAFSALCDQDTLVVFDKLNHASMYDGISQSKANLVRYNHLDYNQLEDILKKNSNYKKKIVSSETVFGMDGDIADVGALSYLAGKHGALLYLDEAHATGLYGINGLGISTKFKLNKETTIIMGTFSKALASTGAYITCSNLLKNYILQKSRPFIYSTAVSPFCIGVAMHNWNSVKRINDYQLKLKVC